MNELQPTPIETEDDFIAQALALEEERARCFGELADSLEAHHNVLAAGLLHVIAAQFESDAAPLERIARARELDDPAPWACLWAAQDSLHTRLQSAHYLMGEAEAVMLAIHSHEHALAFHRAVLTDHPQAAGWASADAFAERHRARLEALQARLKQTQPSPPAGADLDPPNMPE